MSDTLQPLTLTGAELAVLAAMFTDSGTGLAASLKLPVLDSTGNGVGSAGAASLYARGLVWDEGEETAIDPTAALAGLAVAAPASCVAVLVLGPERPSVARVVDAATARVSFAPRAFGNVEIGLLDANVPLSQLLAGVVGDFVDAGSTVCVDVEVNNAAAEDRNVKVEPGPDDLVLVTSDGEAPRQVRRDELVDQLSSLFA